MKKDRKKTIFKKIKKIAYVVQLVLFLILFLLAVFVFVAPDTVVKLLAHYVVKEDEVKRADAIVVIGGVEDNSRSDLGIELYMDGYAPEIIFSGMADFDYARVAIEEYGISEDEYFNENTARSTFENAYNLVEYVEEHEIESILLVCAPAQSRRAKFMFEKVLKDVEIICTFSEETDYDPDNVLDDKETREQLSSEIIKSSYYYIKYAFY